MKVLLRMLHKLPLPAQLGNMSQLFKYDVQCPQSVLYVRPPHAELSAHLLLRERVTCNVGSQNTSVGASWLS